MHEPTKQSPVEHSDGAPSEPCTSSTDLTEPAGGPLPHEGADDPLPDERTGDLLPDDHETAQRDDDATPNHDIEAAIASGVERILEAFETKLAYDESKQRQIDRLHEELQRHRADLVARTAAPLIRGMIHHHDSIGKLLSALRGRPDDERSVDNFLDLLEGLQGDVEIVLERSGVVAYREQGAVFEPRRQRVLRTIAMGDEALSGTVAESLRPGFEQDGRILEKERVSVYKLDPSLCEVVRTQTREDEAANPQQSGPAPAETQQRDD